jgi:hypothetical protein
VGLEPTSLSTDGFQNRFLTISGDLRCSSQRRGQESNLRPSGSEPDTTTNSCYPGSGNAKDRAMLPLASQTRGRGFEPLSPDSKSGSLPLADPRIGFIESAMRELNPPIQLGRLAPLPIGQWHIFLLQRKERESNSQGIVSARPLSRRLPSPLGLPFRNADSVNKPSPCVSVDARAEFGRTVGKAPVAGIEPALIRLTGGCLTVWPHRNV